MLFLEKLIIHFLGTKKNNKNMKKIKNIKDSILASICVMSSKEDLDTYGKMFFDNIIKSNSVETICVITIPIDSQEERYEIKENSILFKMVYYYYSKNIGINFSQIRNFMKSLASGKWIISIDMDEIIPTFQHDELISELNKYKNNDDILGLRVAILSPATNVSESDKLERVLSGAVRIFKNKDDILWMGEIHELIEWTIPQEKIGDINLTYHHFGYLMTKEQSMQKFKRNIIGLSRELATNNNTLMFNFFARYMQKTIFSYNSMFNELNEKNNFE